MAAIGPATVDDYIASAPPAAQDALRRVRAAIVAAVPTAPERIAYKMPSYALPGGGTVHFAGWKRHYSLYFASERVVAAFKDELARFDVQKGTISFPLSEPVPVELIERIVRFHAAQGHGKSAR
jgi:uncharacterized protein YdhG (YjbR/CyaY superfamily)